MKRGTLIALLVVVVIVLGLLIAAGLIYMQFTAEPYIPDQAYLKIELHGPVAETQPAGLAGVLADVLNIQDLWYQINRAAKDTRIRGIVLRIADLECGFAKIEEIGRLLKQFGQSKKPVLAFIESGGLREYYLASFADQVVLFKSGMLTVAGVAAEAMFLKKTLDKLGIQAEVFHIGEYKTASNTFTEERMTPAHRESLEALLADIHRDVIAGIARNRKLDPQAVRRVLEESPLPKSEYLKAGWIDRIGYEDEVYSLLKHPYPWVNFKTYCKTTSPRPFIGANKIAVIFASGQIQSGGSGQSPMGGEALGSGTLAEQLRSVRNAYNVKAVVLRVDSPGGSAVASDVILREAELLARKKPLVVSMSDLAASGGYWISLAGAKIMAEPETITGSIGVISGKFVLKGLYDKIGITKELLKTTPDADMYSDYEGFSEAQKRKIMAGMQEIYTEFLHKVSLSRKQPLADVDRIARGRVWSGQAALRLKLIDQIGGLNDAIQEARNLARIPANEPIGIRVFPQKKSFWDIIFELGGATLHLASPLKEIEAQIRFFKTYYPALAMPFQVKFN